MCEMRNGGDIEQFQHFSDQCHQCLSVVRLFRALRDCFQHVCRSSVVAKSLTHVHEEIFVPGRKHKAAAELQRIFSQAMLFVSCGFCSLARLQIVFAQKVQQGSVSQAHSLVRFALVINEKRELNAGFLAEELGIAGIAQSNNSQMSAFLLELGFKFAQLRDMLSAEDSTVMAKEDHHSRCGLPQRSESRRFAVGVGERYSSQLAAE